MGRSRPDLEKRTLRANFAYRHVVAIASALSSSTPPGPGCITSDTSPAPIFPPSVHPNYGAIPVADYLLGERLK